MTLRPAGLCLLSPPLSHRISSLLPILARTIAKSEATEASNEIKEGCKVTIQKADGSVFKYHITKNAIKGDFTGEFKQIATSSSLAQVMLGKKTGDSFEFGSFEFEILEME